MLLFPLVFFVSLVVGLIPCRSAFCIFRVRFIAWRLKLAALLLSQMEAERGQLAEVKRRAGENLLQLGQGIGQPRCAE
jgi:hypothetical protein